VTGRPDPGPAVADDSANLSCGEGGGRQGAPQWQDPGAPPRPDPAPLRCGVQWPWIWTWSAGEPALRRHGWIGWCLQSLAVLRELPAALTGGCCVQRSSAALRRGNRPWGARRPARRLRPNKWPWWAHACTGPPPPAPQFARLQRLAASLAGAAQRRPGAIGSWLIRPVVALEGEEERGPGANALAEQLKAATQRGTAPRPVPGGARIAMRWACCWRGNRPSLRPRPAQQPSLVLPQAGRTGAGNGGSVNDGGRQLWDEPPLLLLDDCWPSLKCASASN